MDGYLKTEFKMYAKTFLFGLVILAVALAYLYVRRWSFDLFLVNRAAADTSTLLIGLSMVLSGISYFWNFADSKLSYRKQLGVIGFGFGLAHYILSVGFLNERFKLDWLVNGKPAIYLAQIALVVFLIMAVFSFFELAFIRKWGENSWRKFLRFSGYAALGLIGYHLVVLKYASWIKWMKTPDSWVPPLGLIVAIFILFVFIIRLAMWISNIKKNSNKEINNGI